MTEQSGSAGQASTRGDISNEIENTAAVPQAFVAGIACNPGRAFNFVLYTVLTCGLSVVGMISTTNIQALPLTETDLPTTTVPDSLYREVLKLVWGGAIALK